MADDGAIPEFQPDQREADDAITIVEPLCAVFRRALKSAGQKYTPERARILDAILGYEGLFDAERLVTDLADAGVSKATVYRTVKLLDEAGVIRRVPIEQDQAVYQLAYGASPDLVIRLDNNQVIPIRIPELDAIRDRLCKQLGLIAESHRFMIFAKSPESMSEGH
ncbi:MAG: Fur family transcriptional regulator [Phycisphaerales bacterium]|jgi:Fur family ferric uptake transcriptional regulator